MPSSSVAANYRRLFEFKGGEFASVPDLLTLRIQTLVPAFKESQMWEKKRCRDNGQWQDNGEHRFLQWRIKVLKIGRASCRERV